jgi:hypothetical protein
MKIDRFRDIGLLIFVAVSLVAYTSMVRLQRASGAPLHGSHLLQTIGLYLLASVLFLWALVWIERRGGISISWVWGAAVLFRLPFLLAAPALSDDVYRYLWDGHVANHGVSPYAYAVEAPELDYLHVPGRDLVNHAWMASPYLPSAQFVFRALAFILPQKPGFVQIVMITFDLLSAFLLSKLLALASLPRHRLLLYLWNPLVIVEIAYSAHVDAWMIFLTLMAVYLTLAKPEVRSPFSSPDSRLATGARDFLAPGFLALATLTKVIPILLLPILFWRWSWRQRILYAAVTIGLLLPAALKAGWGLVGNADGTGLFGALRIYVDQWNFNSGLFHWLELWLGAQGFGRPSPQAKTIILTLLIVILLVLFALARERRPTTDTIRLMTVPFSAYLLLTPTFHPWYLLIMLIFLPFLTPSDAEPRWFWLPAIPWLYLGSVLSLSYITYIDRLNPGEQEWVRQIEWQPTLLLLGISLSGCVFFQQRNKRKQRDVSETAMQTIKKHV